MIKVIKTPYHQLPVLQELQSELQIVHFQGSCIMMTYSQGQFKDIYACPALHNTKNMDLPVCVELICLIEEVKVGNVISWSRLNCFLLD